MNRRSFVLGIVVGILLCLGVPRLMAIHVIEPTLVPDSAVNLALVLDFALDSAPQRLADYYTDGRQDYLTQAEIDYLARLWRQSPGGTDIRIYVALRNGGAANANAKTVLFWAVEPGRMGNRYWEVQDIAVMDAAEFDAHRLAGQLKEPQ